MWHSNVMTVANLRYSPLFSFRSGWNPLRLGGLCSQRHGFWCCFGQTD